MKDENRGSIFTEFVGFRSKMYALQTEDKVTKRVKMLKKNVVEYGISFDDYNSCLIDVEQYRGMN